MPANLTPQYHEAEKRYRAARSVPERVAALQEMLAVMPKHKGTDHLKADLRAKIAKLTDELEQPTGTHSSRSYPFAIRKEGAGQVVLVGLPNSGKSSLLAALTGANVKVAPYPLTTQLPTPGMLRFENVYIQMVDTPPLAQGRLESRLFGLLRNADVLVTVVDLAADAAGQVQAVVAALAQWGMEPLSRGEGGATDRGRRTADLSAPTFGPDPDRWQTQKPLIVAANKADMEGALEEFQRLEAAYGARFPLVLVSAAAGVGLEELGREVFQALSVVRIYTKPPGREPSFDQPMVLPQGSTVEDAAVDVHKDWQHKLKYALLWGSGKFEGQRVGRDYVLADGDVLELHG